MKVHEKDVVNKIFVNDNINNLKISISSENSTLSNNCSFNNAVPKFCF